MFWYSVLVLSGERMVCLLQLHLYIHCKYLKQVSIAVISLFAFVSSLTVHLFLGRFDADIHLMRTFGRISCRLLILSPGAEWVSREMPWRGGFYLLLVRESLCSPRGSCHYHYSPKHYSPQDSLKTEEARRKAKPKSGLEMAPPRSKT